MYVIVTNHVNWHREDFRSVRENTVNLKMQFELGPCHQCMSTLLQTVALESMHCNTSVDAWYAGSLKLLDAFHGYFYFHNL